MSRVWVFKFLVFIFFVKLVSRNQQPQIYYVVDPKVFGDGFHFLQ
jgi:hypothetical protein